MLKSIFILTIFICSIGMSQAQSSVFNDPTRLGDFADRFNDIDPINSNDNIHQAPNRELGNEELKMRARARNILIKRLAQATTSLVKLPRSININRNQELIEYFDYQVKEEGYSYALFGEKTFFKDQYISQFENGNKCLAKTLIKVYRSGEKVLKTEARLRKLTCYLNGKRTRYKGKLTQPILL